MKRTPAWSPSGNEGGGLRRPSTRARRSACIGGGGGGGGGANPLEPHEVGGAGRHSRSAAAGDLLRDARGSLPRPAGSCRRTASGPRRQPDDLLGRVDVPDRNSAQALCRAPRKERTHQTIGKAYHCRIMEGLDAFNQRFAVELSADEIEGALESTDEIKAAINAGGEKPPSKVPDQMPDGTGEYMRSAKKDDWIEQLLELESRRQTWPAGTASTAPSMPARPSSAPRHMSRSRSRPR